MLPLVSLHKLEVDKMAFNNDRYMSRLNERLMNTAQYALNDINSVLDEMEMIAENNPDREDIRACIDEIKAKNKKGATESWTIANHWSEHFDGLGGEDTDSAKEEDNKEEQEETTDDEDEE